MNNFPLIGITMGDPAGIGPEVALKAVSDKSIYEFCHPLIIGDAAVIKKTIRLIGLKLKVNSITNIEDINNQSNVVDVYDLKNVDVENVKFGVVSADAGNAAFEAIKKAIDLALENKIDATVTGPINKESLNLAGHKFAGHTEIFSRFTNTKKCAMLLADDSLKVIHVSTHLSLSEACKLVKKERIIEVIELLHEGLKKLGVENPVIGVAGLNPHAGDGGLFGTEEINEIIPAIETANANGFIIEGPIPADTLFLKARYGKYDGCVAMYHDQGHIPFKLNGFTWDNNNQTMSSVRGVNITLGLPIIRVSVDHGTAFEIAGKGIASAEAMLLSIKYASQMVNKYRKTNK